MNPSAGGYNYLSRTCHFIVPSDTGYFQNLLKTKLHKRDACDSKWHK